MKHPCSKWPARRSSALVWLSFLSLVFPVAADSVQYSYDTLGRLVEAVDSTSSQAIEYSYDTIGNITSIQTVSTGALSVAGYSTDQAAPGTQITIYGTGFSTTPSGNTVTFNGVQGTVVSSTSTQLVVTVPSGATAGPILVTTGSGSTIGAPMSGFSPAAANSAPTIIGFSPVIGAPGTAVTISGSRFQPGGPDNIVFNQFSAPLTAATATSLATTVPDDAASGPITVATPYGTATSSSMFFVAPPGYSAGSVAVTGTMTIGTATTVSLPTANTVAIETFSGTAGQYLTLGIASSSFASATLQVYDPNGKLLVSGTISSSTTGLQLPQLRTTGWYSIVLSPAGNTGSVQLTLVAPVSGTLTVQTPATATQQTVSLTPAGQRLQQTFVGTRGQYLTFVIVGNLPCLNASRSCAVTVTGPTGAILVQTSLYWGTPCGSSTCAALTNILELPPLPMSGTYTVLVDPGNQSGTLTFEFYGTQSVTLSPNVNSSLNLTAPGAQGQVSFTASAGQYLTLAVLEYANSASGATPFSNVNITVFGPSGSVWGTPAFSATCSGGGTANPCAGYAIVNIGPIPSNATGTYTVLLTPQIQPGSSYIGTEQGGLLYLTLTSPTVISGALVVNDPNDGVDEYLGIQGSCPPGPPSSCNYPGQGLMLPFTASANQALTLHINAFPGYAALVAATVLDQNGNVVGSNTYSATCGGTSQPIFSGAPSSLGLGTTSASGSYTLLLQQQTQSSLTPCYPYSNGQFYLDLRSGPAESDSRISEVLL